MKAAVISIVAILSVCAFGQDSPRILLTSVALVEMPTMERVELHDDGTLHFLIHLEPGYFNRVAANPDEFAELLQTSFSVFSQDDDAPGWVSFIRHLGEDSSIPYQYEREKEWFPYKFVEGTETERRHRFIIPLKKWLASTGIPKELIEGNQFKLRLRDPIARIPIISLAQIKGADKTKVAEPSLPNDVESEFFSFPSKERGEAIVAIALGASSDDKPLVLNPDGKETQLWKDFVKLHDHGATLQLPGKRLMNLASADISSGSKFGMIGLTGKASAVFRMFDGAQDGIDVHYNLESLKGRRDFVDKLRELRKQNCSIQVGAGEAVGAVAARSDYYAMKVYHPTVQEVVFVMELAADSGFKDVFL